MTSTFHMPELAMKEPAVRLYAPDRAGARPFVDVSLGEGGRLSFDSSQDAYSLANAIVKAARQLDAEIDRQAAARAAAEETSHPYPAAEAPARVDSEKWKCEGCGIIFIGERPRGAGVERCRDCTLAGNDEAAAAAGNGARA